MVRRNFKPSRLAVALKMIKSFAVKKIEIDPKDRMMLTAFGSKSHKLCDFTNDPATLIESFKNIEISGRGELEDGIAFAIQNLVKEIRKIGGKVPRILVVSDDRLEVMGARLEKMAKLAKGLGIFIDIAHIGTQEKPTLLKQLAQLTGGDYGYFNNEKALINAGAGFASKKELQADTYFAKDDKKEPPLISEVAVELRKPGLGELRDLMHGKKIEKCQICYQERCPTCKAHFYSCGRYCPNCSRPIHLHCATLWAQKSPEAKENIFRCPNCYFLLRVPKSVMKLMDQSHEHDEEEQETKTTKMVRVPDEQVAGIDESCSFCHNIFTGEEPVFKCQTCGTYYHEKCLGDMYTQLGACRSCGLKII